MGEQAPMVDHDKELRLQRRENVESIYTAVYDSPLRLTFRPEYMAGIRNGLAAVIAPHDTELVQETVMTGLELKGRELDYRYGRMVGILLGEAHNIGSAHPVEEA